MHYLLRFVEPNLLKPLCCRCCDRLGDPVRFVILAYVCCFNPMGEWSNPFVIGARQILSWVTKKTTGVNAGPQISNHWSWLMIKSSWIIHPKFWCGYGSIPINTIFGGMNIHLPAILMFTRGTRFWHTAMCFHPSASFFKVLLAAHVSWLNPHLPVNELSLFRRRR